MQDCHPVFCRPAEEPSKLPDGTFPPKTITTNCTSRAEDAPWPATFNVKLTASQSSTCVPGTFTGEATTGVVVTDQANSFTIAPPALSQAGTADAPICDKGFTLDYGLSRSVPSSEPVTVTLDTANPVNCTVDGKESPVTGVPLAGFVHGEAAWGGGVARQTQRQSDHQHNRETGCKHS